MGETGTGGSLLGVGEGEREPAVAAMTVGCLHSSVVSRVGEDGFSWF